MFEIEKGIEITKSENNGTIDYKYPFNLMDIGDSFFVPCEKSGTAILQRNISQLARNRRPKKFTVRRLEGGVRCWRII